MPVTEAEALAVVSLASMKLELRIELTETSHDALLTAQIVNAVSYVSESTGRAVDDLGALRQAAVAICREQYDGRRELSKFTTFDSWLDPFRSIAG